jgi:hypothetical protein
MIRILKYGIPLILIALMFTNAPYQLLTQRTLEGVTISDKQISTETDKETGNVVSTYLIYTNRGVFRNDDARWFLKFDSSDFYGDLEKGKTYDLKVYGWRIPILSMYPNIVRMKEVTAPQPPKKA